MRTWNSILLYILHIWPFMNACTINCNFYIYLHIYFFCYLFQSSAPACSCVDCEDSCPVPPPSPPKPAPFKIMGFDGYAVVMVIIFIIATLLFLIAVMLCSSGRKLGKFLPSSYIYLSFISPSHVSLFIFCSVCKFVYLFWVISKLFRFKTHTIYH